VKKCSYFPFLVLFCVCDFNSEVLTNFLLQFQLIFKHKVYCGIIKASRVLSIYIVPCVRNVGNAEAYPHMALTLK
jgi:hypothetical protein